MNRIKKLVWGFAATLLAVNLFAVAGYAAANEAKAAENGRAYLESAYREFTGLTGFHGDIAMDVKSPLFAFSAITKFDIYQGEEWVLKADTESVFSLSGREQHKMQIQQYLQKKPGEIVCYANTGDRWIKSALQDKKTADGSDLAAMMQLLKKVEIQDENDELVVLKAVVDMEKVSKMAADALLEQTKKSAVKQSAEEMKRLNETRKMQEICIKAMQHMGDISYVVTIDKKSSHIVNVMIDMTEALQKSKNFVLADMQLSKEQKAMTELMLKDTQVFIQEDFSRFGEVLPFSVPAKVLKSAVDAETYKKEMVKKAKQAS